MKYVLLPCAILATVAVMFSAITPAHACICVTGETKQERVERSHTILVGQIAEVANRSVTVSVERFLKGSGETPLAVGNLASCGARLSLDQRYILFLHISPPPLGRGDLETSMCSWNVYLAGGRIGEEIAARLVADVEAITGPGQPPDNAEPIAPAEDGDFPREAFWALAIVLPIALLAAATLSRWRRR
jgi:hypothetical protein